MRALVSAAADECIPLAARQRLARSASQRRSRTTLAYDEALCIPQGHAGVHVESVQPPHAVLFLHGLLGSSRNWRTFARALGNDAAIATQARWRMLMLDLRSHGASSRLHGFNPPHSMQAAAQDVVDFIKVHLGGQRPVAILGHSLGGKVLLELLRLLRDEPTTVHSSRTPPHPPSTPARLHWQPPHQPQHGWAAPLLPPQAWVLDSQPGLVTPEMDTQTGVNKVLQAVQEIRPPIPSRTWLQNHFKNDRGFSTGLSNMLGSSVTNDGQGNLTWAFNLTGVTSLYHSYMVTDSWDQLKHPPAGVDVHFVRAGLSDRWVPASAHRLDELAAAHKHSAALHAQQRHHQPRTTGRFHLHVLPQADHNVHISDPQGLLRVVLPRLVRVVKPMHPES